MASPEVREETSRGQGLLRVLVVLLGCLAFAVGNPWYLVTVPLALLLVLLPVQGWVPRLVGLFFLAWVFTGVQQASPRDLDLGWSVLVGGLFVVASLALPRADFMSRALVALLGAMSWSGFVYGMQGGWAGVEGEVQARVQQASEATSALIQGWTDGGRGEAVVGAAARTAELQVIFFPAQLALASLLGLAAAWWFFCRIAMGSSGGLGPWLRFRFPDVWIWALIAGITLMVVGGWQEGIGRVGANLTVFMGSLYVIRGAAVLFVLSGGPTFRSVLLVVLGLVLASPVLLAGALFAGLGDTWFDLRSRAARAVPPGSGENS